MEDLSYYSYLFLDNQNIGIGADDYEIVENKVLFFDNGDPNFLLKHVFEFTQIFKNNGIENIFRAYGNMKNLLFIFYDDNGGNFIEPFLNYFKSGKYSIFLFKENVVKDITNGKLVVYENIDLNIIQEDKSIIIINYKNDQKIIYFDVKKDLSLFYYILKRKKCQNRSLWKLLKNKIKDSIIILISFIHARLTIKFLSYICESKKSIIITKNKIYSQIEEFERYSFEKTKQKEAKIQFKVEQLKQELKKVNEQYQQLRDEYLKGKRIIVSLNETMMKNLEIRENLLKENVEIKNFIKENIDFTEELKNYYLIFSSFFKDIKETISKLSNFINNKNSYQKELVNFEKEFEKIKNKSLKFSLK